jgi:hypothetical protein
VTAGSAPSVDRWRASTTPGISTSVPIVTARSGAPGATRRTFSAPACDGADESPRPREPDLVEAGLIRGGSEQVRRRCPPVDPVGVGDETKQCPMSAAQGVAYDGTSRARCLAIVRPAFVPRTTRRRQENYGTAGASNPHVRNRIRALPQVAKSAPRTLSRWRHGFKSRWDYERESAGQRPCSAVNRVKAIPLAVPDPANIRTRSTSAGPRLRRDCLSLADDSAPLRDPSRWLGGDHHHGTAVWMRVC